MATGASEDEAGRCIHCKAPTVGGDDVCPTCREKIMTWRRDPADDEGMTAAALRVLARKGGTDGPQE